MREYPFNVCYECGARYGDIPAKKGAHWRDGICEVCGHARRVTDPETFGRPHFRGHEEQS